MLYFLKRPLVVAALSVLFISVMLMCFFPSLFFPENNLSDGEITCISGEIYKIEEKPKSFYIYIKTEQGKSLLAASKKIFDQYQYSYGNRIRSVCRFSVPQKAANFGNYDEESYLKSIGVRYKYRAESVEMEKSTVSVVPELLRRQKLRMIKVIRESISDGSSQAGVIIAICTGDKSYLDDEISSLYKESGIAHILAISGLHISFVGMGCFRLLRRKFKYFPSALLALAFTIAYVIMSGGAPSAIRASIMVAVRLGAVRIGRKYDLLSSASLAAILLLIPSPYYVTNSGFILSFAAVTGIAVISGPTEYLLGKVFIPEKTGFVSDKRKRLNWYIKSFIKTCASGTAVTLTTLPIITSMYYEFPLYGILINVLILPFVSYILCGGLLGALAGMIFPAIGKIGISLSASGLIFIGSICSLGLKLPFANVCTGKPSAVSIVIYYVLLVILTAVLRVAKMFDENRKQLIKKHRNTTAGRLSKILIFAIFAFLLSIFLGSGGNSGQLQVFFFNVDQGKCIVVRTAQNQTFMIDCGSTGVEEVYKNRISSALKYEKITKIDCVLITHPDTDHISGILEMLETGDVNIGKICIPDCSGNDKYEKILLLADKKGVDTEIVYKGMAVAGDGVVLRCIYPEKDRRDGNINEMSAVFRLEYGTFSAVFTGDIEGKQERNLLNDVGKANVLDVAHHGSRYSSTKEFLNKVSPEVAVISAGVNNSYGHPHKETISRLYSAGAVIYNTADCGEVIVNVENGRITYVTSFGVD